MTEQATATATEQTEQPKAAGKVTATKPKTPREVMSAFPAGKVVQVPLSLIRRDIIVRTETGKSKDHPATGLDVALVQSYTMLTPATMPPVQLARFSEQGDDPDASTVHAFDGRHRLAARDKVWAIIAENEDADNPRADKAIAVAWRAQGWSDTVPAIIHDISREDALMRAAEIALEQFKNAPKRVNAVEWENAVCLVLKAKKFLSLKHDQQDAIAREIGVSRVMLYDTFKAYQLREKLPEDVKAVSKSAIKELLSTELKGADGKPLPEDARVKLVTQLYRAGVTTPAESRKAARLWTEMSDEGRAQALTAVESGKFGAGYVKARDEAKTVKNAPSGRKVTGQPVSTTSPVTGPFRAAVRTLREAAKVSSLEQVASLAYNPGDQAEFIQFREDVLASVKILQSLAAAVNGVWAQVLAQQTAADAAAHTPALPSARTPAAEVTTPTAPAEQPAEGPTDAELVEIDAEPVAV